jgi:hypothetical protein
MAIIVPAGLWLGLAISSIASPLNISPSNSAKSASILKRQIDVGVSLDGICTNGDITTVVGIRGSITVLQADSSYLCRKGNHLSARRITLV